MTLFFTDRPLEDFLEHVPPKKGPVVDEIHNIGGKEIHTRSDLWNPREYREHLIYGPLVLQKYTHSHTPLPDTIPSDVDTLLLERGNNWFAYITSNECTYHDMEQMLFIYWYLSNAGNRICIYRQDGLEFLGPETPVSRVDVSKKPISGTILRNIQTDILYLFFDAEGTSPSHDTRILHRMRMDPLDERFPSFRAPKNGLTLSGLRDVLGNCYSLIKVYDHMEVETTADRLRFKDYKEAYKDYVRPIEIVARTREFADEYINNVVDESVEVGKSFFDNCPVRMYKFRESQYEMGCREARIQDLCGIDDTMSVIAVVDRGSRKRPIPELVFRDADSFEREGMHIHRLYCRITPDAVYGEFYIPSQSKENLSIWIELQMTSSAKELTGLKVELEISNDMHTTWNLMEHANGILDLWCIDRMGATRDPKAESEEDVMLKTILDDAEGVQDGSVKSAFDSFVPLVAVKRVLTRATDALVKSEPGLPQIIDRVLEDYDREHASNIVRGLYDEVRVDVQGCIFIPDVDGNGPGIRVAKRFGGKG